MGSNLVMQIGYALSSEEHRPLDLVRSAKRAEEAGFSFAVISDHDPVYVHQVGLDQDGFFDAYQRGTVAAIDDIAPKREREATVA